MISSRRPAIVSVALGAVLACGQIPSLGPWAAFISIAALWAALLHVSHLQRPRQMGLAAWALGIGYFAVALSWIVNPFLVDVARHGWMAPFALAFLAAGLALFWGAAGVVAARLAKAPNQRALLFALLLVAAEATRAHVFTGFPWASLGHSLVDTPLVQLAAIFGPAGLSLFVALLAASPFVLPGRAWVGIGLAASIAAAVWIWGQSRPIAIAQADDSTPIVRVLQPDAAQHLKWAPDHIRRFLDRSVALTAMRHPDTRPPDLIVWPETSLATPLSFAESTLAVIGQAAGDAAVVLGGHRRGADGSVRNSLAVIGEGGQIRDIYDKHHLVPFGEYLPFSDLLKRVGLRGLAEARGGYGSGDGPATVNLDGIGQAIALICYEAIFPHEVRRVSARPRLLIQITNDGWFGGGLGPDQHLVQARLRAIEMGLPMVRSANRGHSAVIDPFGRLVTGTEVTSGESVQRALGPVWAGRSEVDLDLLAARTGREALSLDAPLPEALPPTIYAQHGELPVSVVWVVLVACTLLVNRYSRPALDDTGPHA